MKARHTLFVLAIAACGNPRSTPKVEHDPAPAKIAATPVEPTPVEPTPAALPRGPSFAAKIYVADVVDGKKIDATSLGGDVQVYLVAQMGGAADQDPQQAQREERSLLLVGASSMRLPLGRVDVVVDAQRPFGTVVTADAFPDRAYDAAEDGFAGAPVFPATGTVVVASTQRSQSGDIEAFVVTRDGRALTIWTAEEAFEDGASDHWTKVATFTLAKDVKVTAGVAPTDEPSFGESVSVQILDHVDASKGRREWHSVSLWVGDRVGPLAEAETTGGGRWVKDADVTVPGADEILASRPYEIDGERREIAIGRVDGAIAAWQRVTLDTEGAWIELTRIALPNNAKVTMITPMKRKPVDMLVPKLLPGERPRYSDDEPEGDPGEEEGVVGGVVGGEVTAPPTSPPPGS